MNCSSFGHRWLCLCFIVVVLVSERTSPAYAQEPITIRVDTIQGQAQYPLALIGLREVLIADLSKDPGIRLSTVPETELVLTLAASEDPQELRIVVSLMDQVRQYNLGAKTVRGQYTAIKALQDELFLAAASLIKPVPDNQTTKAILQGHTKSLHTLHQLGTASSALSQSKPQEALAAMDRILNRDPEFAAGKDRALAFSKRIQQSSKDMVITGDVYALSGDTDKALAQYDAALKINAKQTSALISKAKLLRQKGRFAEAIQHLNEALAVDANSSECHGLIGQIYLQMNQLDQAEASLAHAVRLGSSDPKLFDAMGQVQAKRKKAAEAARMFVRAGDLSSNAFDTESSKKFYRLASENDPTLQITLKEADAMIRSGDIEVALQYISRKLVSDPNNDALIAQQAYAYYLSKQPALALKRCYVALEINPKNYFANYLAGLLLSRDPQTLKEAQKYLETAKTLKPQELDPVLLLSDIYLKMSRHETAIKLLEEMSRVKPRDAIIFIRLGDAYLGFEKHDDALLAYQKASEIAPHLIEAYEGLALIYLYKNDRTKLLTTLDKIYELNPSDNLMIRNGPALLSRILPQALLDSTAELPKYYIKGNTESGIHQITLARVLSSQWFKRHILPKFELFTVNTSLLEQDLRLALYTRYRVVLSKGVAGLQQGTIPEAELANPSGVAALLRESRLNGLLAYRATVADRAEATDAVRLRVLMHVADGSAIDDGSFETTILYPKHVVVVFNTQALLYYALSLFLLVGPSAGAIIYRRKKIGKGTVKVTINYDPSLESFLTLKLSTTELTPKDSQSLIVKDKQQADKKKYKSLLKQTGAFVQQMVGKTTFFENVPARDYYCYLFGTIEDTGLTKKTVGNYFMFQQFDLKKDETKEIIFQLEREEAYVVVHAYENDISIDGVEVTILELNEPRYTRAQQGAFFYLKKGNYTVRAQYQGKQYFQDLIVDRIADLSVVFNLSDVASLAQQTLSEEDIAKRAAELRESGRSKDAVELLKATGKEDEAQELSAEQAIEEGDYATAAQIYTKAKDFLRASDAWKNAGNDVKAHEMRAAYHLQHQEFAKAIPHLEACGNLTMLAKVYQRLGDTKKHFETLAKAALSRGEKQEAVSAYVQAEEYIKAGELLEETNQLEKAATTYAKGGHFELAADLFVRIGDTKRAAIAYEQGGYFEEAIAAYETLQDSEKVLQLLTEHQQYLRAAQHLVHQGLVDDAISLLQKVPSKDRDFEETQILMATLMAQKGMHELALATLNKVARQDGANFPMDTHYAYADMLESSGEFERAKVVFETLLTRDFQFKDVEQRLLRLRERSKQAPSNAPMGGVQQGADQTIAGGVKVYSAAPRYEIIKELGRGAMGVVYQARDTKLDRIVAFKTLPQSITADPAAVEALKSEAMLTAKLSHPNIVTIFDVGEEAGNMYIAMEFVDGKTLQDVLKQVKRLNADAFKLIFSALASGVQYAHDHQIIHRDIKPSNILVSPKTKTVKLMDFGLAKLLEGFSIDKTMLRGTPLYMAPEQIVGQDIDTRADIYAMGIMMYEALTGAPPFTQGDIMYAHLHTQPKAISELLPSLNPNLASLIMACLQKDKTQRPSSAQAIIDVVAA